ncbi:hypothetical protein F5Y10DRAFT_263682 [Nemania abortiva]|nr:hypothetical protein F5Y10DRAFT_263682 [Nemania abortiva]
MGSLAAEAFGVIVVDADTLEAAGYNPNHYFKALLSWGYGEGQFPVQIDVFHQIHYLNTVQKQMYYQFYYANQFPNGPEKMHWIHQRHCPHMVMQSLTCNANVDIVPHRWVDNDVVPFAQFIIERKCRNLDNLRRWNQYSAVKNVHQISQYLSTLNYNMDGTPPPTPPATPPSTPPPPNPPPAPRPRFAIPVPIAGPLVPLPSSERTTEGNPGSSNGNKAEDKSQGESEDVKSEDKSEGKKPTDDESKGNS